MSKSFKELHPLDKRIAESKRIRDKYPDRIPVIVEKSTRAKNIPDIDKKKFLVPGDLTFSQMLYVIRKRIKINEQQAIFVFIKNNLVPQHLLMNQIYKENVDEDGFLYCVYTGENTFG